MGCLYLAISKLLESSSNILTCKISQLNFLRKKILVLLKKLHLEPRKEISPKKDFTWAIEWFEW